ncbi:MAG: hypothetical protein U1E65_10805 [Myxococcota bacterium]
MKSWFFWISMSCLACAPAPPKEDPKTVVVQTLRLERERMEGISIGFDLDGKTSTDLDDTTCRKPDFVDPDGKPGIDNQLARLLPLIDVAGQGAIDALLQGAINEGKVILVMELDPGTGSWKVLRGKDTPLLGADGRVLAGQTLALDSNADLGSTTSVHMRDDTHVDIDPMALDLPVIVFGELYELKLADARSRLTWNEDGSLDGVLGGSVPVEQILTMVRTAQGMSGVDYLGLFGGSIRETADLGPDGTGDCDAISMAATFHAVPAFTFEP